VVHNYLNNYNWNGELTSYSPGRKVVNEWQSCTKSVNNAHMKTENKRFFCAVDIVVQSLEVLEESDSKMKKKRLGNDLINTAQQKLSLAPSASASQCCDGVYHLLARLSRSGRGSISQISIYRSSFVSLSRPNSKKMKIFKDSVLCKMEIYRGQAGAQDHR
jgi:hypothetical protein